MAKFITKSQMQELEDACTFGIEGANKLLKKYAGIQARAYTAYSYYDEPGIPGNAACLRAGVSCREIQIQDKPDGLCRRGGRQARMREGGRMQGNLGLTPVQAPCKGCADRHTGCHTDCTRYIAFRREADRYKQEQSKDAARYATTRGCMRTLRDATRARREGRQHY